VDTHFWIIVILFLFLLIEFLKGKFKKRSHLILLLNEYYGTLFSVVHFLVVYLTQSECICDFLLN
jgi:hypothetical protein